MTPRPPSRRSRTGSSDSRKPSPRPAAAPRSKPSRGSKTPADPRPAVNGGRGDRPSRAPVMSQAIDGASRAAEPRLAATLALAHVAEHWPHAAAMEPAFDGLADPRDGRLARAIWHVALQRWLTLAHVLDGYLKQPLHQLEPLMQGVLLAGTAQLVFMDRLPAHAVVDESVSLARRLIRPGAGGLSNAVLRKVATLAESPVRGKPWSPAQDRLPTDEGYIPLAAPVLPPVPALPEGDDQPLPDEDRWALALHLDAATSHPAPLVDSWIARFGHRQAIAICLHGVMTPPTIVSVEPGLAIEAQGDTLAAHAQQGFALWQGRPADLPAFLQGHVMRRVQDPASSLAVASSAELQPDFILDYCAGRGTKTRQLALTHPKARVLASDTSVERLKDLARVAAATPMVRVAHVDELPRAMASHKADLLLLDVPCSNTGVLARRPGAKYRYDAVSLESLVKLQRQIIKRSLPLLARPGWLLYSTCSLDELENQRQVAWILRITQGKLLHEKLTLPHGAGQTYQDGSYHALIALPG